MRILFHKNFEKQYKRLSSKTRSQFKKRLKIFTKNPFDPILHNHVLGGERQDFRSINVTGDFRALYVIIDEDTVQFMVIDTHSNLYS